jgi:hypothetical protein
MNIKYEVIVVRRIADTVRCFGWVRDKNKGNLERSYIHCTILDQEMLSQKSRTKEMREQEAEEEEEGQGEEQEQEQEYEK